jgi:hypothetical protein
VTARRAGKKTTTDGTAKEKNMDEKEQRGQKKKKGGKAEQYSLLEFIGKLPGADFGCKTGHVQCPACHGMSFFL